MLTPKVRVRARIRWGWTPLRWEMHMLEGDAMGGWTWVVVASACMRRAWTWVVHACAGPGDGVMAASAGEPSVGVANGLDDG